MIITKTPYRISFFGGGSDYPSWYEKNGGAVLSTTINKFLYISCRFSPKYFKKKYRIIWRKIENVQRVNQINHKAVRELLKYLKIKSGLEIHYYGDLPARSGMGSSSCFTVGLMQTLYRIKKINLNKLDLAKKSIYFEQNVMKEVVGSQDQVSATYGGFNKIVFKTGGGFNVFPFSSKKKKIQKLNKNLLLVYSGLTRTAHHIAKSYVHKLQTSKKSHILEILNFVKEGERILKEGKLDDFGKLLHESWLEKKSLSPLIANSHINEIYDLALKKGALGGKLLGAGGGGFLVFYVPHHKQKNFIRHFKNLINVPFKFTSEGSNIMFNNFNN